MLLRLNDLRETLSTVSSNRVDFQKLERSFGKLEQKVESASQQLSYLVKFHQERELIELGLGEAQLQQDSLRQEQMNYSSAPLAETLSHISFAPIMKEKERDHLQSLKDPIRQAIESVIEIVPGHGKEFRSSIGAELKETWAQTALATKRVRQGTGQAHADVVLGLFHWRQLQMEYHTYHATLQAGKNDIIKTIDFLKSSHQASTRSLILDYTSLLKQLENEIQEADTLLSWINEYDVHMESKVNQATQQLLQNEGRLNETLDSLSSTIQLLKAKGTLSPQDLLSWNRASMQLHALLESVPPAPASAFDYLRSVVAAGVELDHVLAPMSADKGIIDQATRMAYRGGISAITPMKKCVSRILASEPYWKR
jgi:hypothetical protein